MRRTNTEITPGVVLTQIHAMLEALQRAERQVISAIEEHNNDPHAHGGAIMNAVKSLLPSTDTPILVDKGNRHQHTGSDFDECEMCSDLTQVPTSHVGSGGFRITIDSAPRINLLTSGVVTLNFVAADINAHAVKVIYITSENETALTIRGAYWAYNDRIPPWGNPGETIILTAHFAGGCVILSASTTSGE